MNRPYLILLLSVFSEPENAVHPITRLILKYCIEPMHFFSKAYRAKTLAFSTLRITPTKIIQVFVLSFFYAVG